MTDDGVRLHVEASVVSVSSSIVFFGNSVKKMCKILGAQVHKILKIYKYIWTFSKYKSSIVKCHFKYISEKYIQSRLKVYFPIFSLKEVYY